MAAIKNQGLIDSINASLAYLVGERGYEKAEQYLLSRYGTFDVEKIPTYRLEELYGDLAHEECDLRD